MWCPESLQIGRHILGSRRRNQQIASKLEIQLFEIWCLITSVGIVQQQLVSQSAILGTWQIIRIPSILVQTDLHPVIDGLIISQMTSVELIETHVLSVPKVVGHLLQIRCALLHRMLVEAVEARFVHDIDDCLLSVGNGER